MPQATGIPPKYLDIDLSPYAGHYIALVEGRVLAVGDTAESALARAKVARPQRPATILLIAHDNNTENTH
ncbi:MAG: hypothetical protein J5I90_00610 [Caldilineales bacterium]|nr:hypothetical protein [Caldilineales bacterium]